MAALRYTEDMDTNPIEPTGSPATLYDAGDLEIEESEALLAAGWLQNGTTLYDPAQWRPCNHDETPDFYIYEDQFMALTPAAKRWAEEED